MSSQDHKKKIEDTIEGAFDKAHKVVDTVTYPLGPIDAVIHGTARGIRNWLLDEHPGDRNNNNNKNCNPNPPNNNNCPPNPPNPSCTPASQPTNHNNFSGNTGNNSNNFSGNNAPAGNNSSINFGGGK